MEHLNNQMLKDIPKERLEQYLASVQEQIGRLAIFQNQIIQELRGRNERT